MLSATELRVAFLQHHLDAKTSPDHIRALLPPGVVLYTPGTLPDAAGAIVAVPYGPAFSKNYKDLYAIDAEANLTPSEAFDAHREGRLKRIYSHTATFGDISPRFATLFNIPQTGVEHSVRDDTHYGRETLEKTRPNIAKLPPSKQSVVQHNIACLEEFRAGVKDYIADRTQYEVALRKCEEKMNMSLANSFLAPGRVFDKQDMATGVPRMMMKLAKFLKLVGSVCDEEAIDLFSTELLTKIPAATSSTPEHVESAFASLQQLVSTVGCEKLINRLRCTYINYYYYNETEWDLVRGLRHLLPAIGLRVILVVHSKTACINLAAMSEHLVSGAIVGVVLDETQRTGRQALMTCMQLLMAEAGLEKEFEGYMQKTNTRCLDHANVTNATLKSAVGADLEDLKAMRYKLWNSDGKCDEIPAFSTPFSTLVDAELALAQRAFWYRAQDVQKELKLVMQVEGARLKARGY